MVTFFSVLFVTRVCLHRHIHHHITETKHGGPTTWTNLFFQFCPLHLNFLTASIGLAISMRIIACVPRESETSTRVPLGLLRDPKALPRFLTRKRRNIINNIYPNPHLNPRENRRSSVRDRIVEILGQQTRCATRKQPNMPHQVSNDSNIRHVLLSTSAVLLIAARFTH